MEHTTTKPAFPQLLELMNQYHIIRLIQSNLVTYLVISYSYRHHYMTLYLNMAIGHCTLCD